MYRCSICSTSSPTFVVILFNLAILVGNSISLWYWLHLLDYWWGRASFSACWIIYILNAVLFSNICLAHNIIQCVACLFTLTVVSFDEQKFIFFIKRYVVRNGGNGEFLINRCEVSVRQDECALEMCCTTLCL